MSDARAAFDEWYSGPDHPTGMGIADAYYVWEAAYAQGKSKGATDVCKATARFLAELNALPSNPNTDSLGGGR